MEEPEYGYYKAIGDIMKAYHFNILVDIYGDIPYFDALQRGSNPTPAYDDAQTIYEDLILRLTDAIALINSTSANEEVTPLAPGSDDGMFGGDMDMWKQFANSVKLRILVRQADMSGRAGYLKEQLNIIKNEGSGFLTENAEVNIGYTKSENQQNPKWDAFGQDPSGTNTLNNNATCATPFVLDYLTATGDPRIDYIYEEPATGHLGVVQGLKNYDSPVVDAYVPELVSNIGPGILKGPDQSAVLMTASEIYFNQAEAILKGLMDGDDETMYKNGVQASFDYLGAGSATSYLGNGLNLVTYTNSSNKEEAIITQKWIALNGIDAIQTWFDYSRTGFPSNLPISELASTPDRPVRLYYPSSELTSNGSNVPSQPNAFTEKIFWAK